MCAGGGEDEADDGVVGIVYVEVVGAGGGEGEEDIVSELLVAVSSKNLLPKMKETKEGFTFREVASDIVVKRV